MRTHQQPFLTSRAEKLASPPLPAWMTWLCALVLCLLSALPASARATRLPPDLATITIVPSVTHEICGIDALATASPPPRPGDAPRWNNQPLSNYAGTCPYDVTIVDGPRRYDCPRNFTFVRRYELRNSCTGTLDTTLVQSVSVGDFTPPEIFPPALPPGRSEHLFPTNAAGCTGTVDTRIGTLTTIDACSPDAVSLICYVFPDGRTDRFPLGPYDVLDPTTSTTAPLAEGRHLFRYVAADGCGNKSSLDLYVHVEASAPALRAVGGAATGLALTANCLGGTNVQFRIPTGYGGGTTTVEVDIDPLSLDGSDFDSDRTINPAFFTGDATTGFSVSILNIPVGKHLARVRSTNDCGGEKTIFVTLTITDGRAPTIRCIIDDVVTLVPDPNFGGLVSVLATDLLSGPAVTCGAPVTEYSIYREDATAGTGFLPQAGREALNFNCSDAGTQIVRVYAFSPANGRHDFCNVVLDVRAGAVSCANQNGDISGTITDAAGRPLPGVEVRVSGSTTTLTAFTDAGGAYHLNGLAENQSYVVRPFHNTDPINGVGTADISLLNRYLAGRDDGLSPYELIAADANRNGSITIRDLTLMRSVILGLEDNFTNNTSWRFIDADYVFPDPANPWLEDFPETVEFPALLGSVRADFTALKVGDLNGSAAPR